MRGGEKMRLDCSIIDDEAATLGSRATETKETNAADDFNQRSMTLLQEALLSSKLSWVFLRNSAISGGVD